MDQLVRTPYGSMSYHRHGEGPDLVLLHSLLADRTVFDGVVPALSRRRRVTVLDLPGFGGTTLVEPSIDVYADFVAAALTALGIVAGCDLLGNGLGAFVALGTAIRHGSLLNRLVLVGCGAGFSEEGKQPFHGMIARVLEKGVGAILDAAVIRILSEKGANDLPAIAAERREALRHTSPEAFVNACRALLDLDYRSQAPGVGNPTLVITGTLDQATPPALGRELVDLIPDSRLFLMEDTAHAPQLQRPEQFVALVEEFLG